MWAKTGETLIRDVVEALPEVKGIEPVGSPEDSGRLEYPIRIENKEATALLDHGASHSFINEHWYQEQGLATSAMLHPMAMTEFSGKVTYVSRILRNAQVEFAGGKSLWTFVASPSTPTAVVIGLDLIRHLQLCYNPANDHLFALPTTDARVVSSGEEVPCAESSSAYAVNTRSETDSWEIDTMEMIMEDAYVKPRGHGCHVVPEACKKTTAEELIVHRSVTASSQEELAENQAALSALDPRIVGLTEEFAGIFTPPDAAPPERSVVHKIRLKPHTSPVRRSPYPLGEVKSRVMKEQISDLASKGWVVLSESAWGAPILFVKKKGGEWRLCTDFRDLNAVSEDDSFPLPRVEMLLHRADNASVFSLIDLVSGFH